MPYPTTPRTWVAGNVLTAAQLNAELRDALLGAFPLGPPDVAWTSYTPTLTQGVALSKTVTYARYQRIGRLVIVVANLAITSAGTAATAVLVGLPVAATAAAAVVGSFRYLDAGTTVYVGTAYGTSTTTVELLTNAQPNPLGIAPAVTAASGDTVQIAISYEAAT